MDRTLLVLVVAHLVGDFLLQDQKMIERKCRIPWLLVHVVIVIAVTAALLGSLVWLPLSVIFLSHIAIDRIKIGMREPRWSPIGAFTIDQLAHLAVLVLVAVLWPNLADDGFWLRVMPVAWQAPYLTMLTIVAGAILAVVVGGCVIAMLMAPIVVEVKSTQATAGQVPAPGAARERSRSQGEDARGADDSATDDKSPDDLVSGLRNGGRMIGCLERGLVFLLVLANQFGGVGFLVAAKSILRFGDIRDAEQRRLTEYVIIGTFMSFGWAMLVSMVTLKFIQYWGD